MSKRAPSREPNSTLPDAIDARVVVTVLNSGVVIRDYRDESAGGRPVILIHSINAAPSAMEMKPLFEGLRTTRTVYAPELPGFGLSERGDFDYSPSMFADAIAEFVKSLQLDEAALAPDIIALSLSCEFAARAVVEQGMPCHSLVMISPTGLSQRVPPAPESMRGLQSVLRAPIVGKGLFKALTSRPSIRFFLKKAFVGDVPEPLVDYAWRTAHQPEAQFAPFAFLSMSLFTRDALASLYAQLSRPVLVVYDRDPNIDFEELPTLLGQSNVRAERIGPSLGLPHWELPEKTLKAINEFFIANGA